MSIKNFKLFIFSLSIIVLIILGGCGNNDDLNEYINTVKAKPGGAIEPLPELLPPETFTYSASGLRSPFLQLLRIEEGGGKSAPQPDADRPKEVLEGFSIDQLSMVGTLQSENSKLWVLISDGAKGVHRVAEGNYLGRNYGKIIKVYEDKIDILEVVPDGRGGWLERLKTMEIKEK